MLQYGTEIRNRTAVFQVILVELSAGATIAEMMS
jgi:hypothetical protein